MNAYIIYCLTTNLKQLRRQFLLEVIKEFCKPKDGVGCVTTYPPVVQDIQHCTDCNQCWITPELGKKITSWCHAK